MKFNVLKLAALLSATVFAAEADKAPRRKRFDATAFLAQAQAPVKVEAEKPAPGKRVPFNAAAFLPAQVPVVQEKEHERRGPFDLGYLAPVQEKEHERRGPFDLGYLAPVVQKEGVAPGKRVPFNAAAFLPAQVPVVQEKEHERRGPFDLGYLAPVVQKEGVAPGKRAPFNAAYFLAPNAEREAALQLDAQENYMRIADRAIGRVVDRAEYVAMLNELKRIGLDCFNGGEHLKQPADWIKTLILTFSNLDDAGRNLLYVELGNNIQRNVFGGDANDFVGGRILAENKLLLAADLYLFLVAEIDAGRIIVPKAPELPPAPVAVKVDAHPAAVPLGPWNFWAGRGAGKRFVMPAGLKAEEQEYVSFFMEKVMPKLAALHAANTIDDNAVETVIRAASMGLVGMTEKHIYLEAFEKILDSSLAEPNYDGTLEEHIWCALVSPDSTPHEIKHKRRFPDIVGGNAFFKDIGPTHNLVTTFDTLHTEDEAKAFAKEYNKLPSVQRVGKVRELKERAKGTVLQKLGGLPQIIYQTFAFMLEKNCADDVWMRFIKGFNTGACYDGTYDCVIPVGTEILASGDGNDQREPIKIFAKMLSNVPANLEAILGDDEMTAFVDVVKAASAGDAANPSAAFLGGTTLDRQFGGRENARIIRDFVGNGPDGNCKLKDAEMLELLYWSYVMSADAIIPPDGLKGRIAKLLMED